MPRDPKQAVKKTTQAQKKVTPVAKEKPAPVVEKESKPVQTQPKSAPQKEKETAKPQTTKPAPKAAPVVQKETKAEKAAASKVVQKPTKVATEPAKPVPKEKEAPKVLKDSPKAAPASPKAAPAKAQKESPLPKVTPTKKESPSPKAAPAKAPKESPSPKVAQNPTPEKKVVQESPKAKKASPSPKASKKEKEVPMEVEQKPVQTKKTEAKKGKKEPEPEPVETSTESDSNEEEMDVEDKPEKKRKSKAVAPGRVDRKQIIEAAKTLLEYKKNSKRSVKTPLFDEGEPVQLMIALGKLQKGPVFKRYCIPVPHPVRENCEICVLVKDPVKKYKPMVKDIPGVTKVIGIEKLRTHFKQFESRRKLQRSYDIFVCDAEIFLLMKGLLGKSFIESKQVPFPVKFNGAVQKNITKIRNGAILNVPTGLQLNLQIGLTSYTPEQLAANVMKAKETFSKKLGGWDNIQCLSLKTVDSPALPFFNQITFSV